MAGYDLPKTKLNYRKERVERLLNELKYEVTRGIMEGELEEYLTFNFLIPRSKLPTEMVRCEFRTAPITRDMLYLAERTSTEGLKVGV
jgi:hypothetical protein